MPKVDLLSLPLPQLLNLLKAKGFNEFHAKQIYRRIYPKKNGEILHLDDSANGDDEKMERDTELYFNGIPDISAALREYLSETFFISRITLKEHLRSCEDTEKFLFMLSDGNTIETVVIKDGKRLTICLSTQIGCKFGCTFCVSGRKGFVRNLSTPEIINQVIRVKENAADDEFVSNIVFMGIGEPLDNYDHVMQTIAILREDTGFYFAKRKIVISTCGLVPGILRLIEDNQKVRLSVSLHSGNDTLRSRLMPVNRAYPLPELKNAIALFNQSQALPVFLEYTLIQNVNMSEQDALDLASFISNLRVIINLIPYNPSPHFPWEPPDENAISIFRKYLERYGVLYTIRRTRGLDIAAACGLLRDR